MERDKKTPMLFLLLALLHVCTVRMETGCPSQDKNLTCYNDYNRTINCVWDSAHGSDHADTVCTIHARRDSRRVSLSSSCNLEPVDVARPTLKSCSLVFKKDWAFLPHQELSMNLSCNPAKQSWNIPYKIACHIKLNPPPRPDINSTTISWFPQVARHKRITLYRSQLQWRKEDQPWSDSPEQKRVNQCDWNCTTELDFQVHGEKYEARVRIQGEVNYSWTIWSDWSPIASWESTVRRTEPPSDVAGVVFGTVACMAVFASFLAVIRSNKTTWILKRISGPPLPSPAKSFLQDADFQNLLSPYFNSESFHSFLTPVKINSVEITSTVDTVAPCRPEAALLEKMRSASNHESASSNFSNPSYSQLCPSPPVSSLTAGNLEPCASDTPYGPVASQGEGQNAGQDSDDMRGKKVKILQLLSKGSKDSEPMPVISDYEKVEKLQVERLRLQSLDSGVCSGEEVSQESLEADSISVTDSHGEGGLKEERKGGNGKEGDFQKLFGGSGGIFGKGSIEVCSDYERVQKLQADSPELPSLDSGISSGGEEQASQEESLEDLDKSTESTDLLFAPPSSTLPCSLPSLTPLPLNFSGPGLSQAPRPLPSHILERIALISTHRFVEPSGDGYMPVRQEQS